MALADDLDAAGDHAEGERKLRAISAELVRLGLDVSELGRLSRISMWQGLTKNKDDEAEIHDLYGFQLSPTWEQGPQWQPVDRGPAVVVRPPKVSRADSSGASLVVVMPDMQIGFYRTEGGLEPTHDEAAINAALAVTKAANPAKVVLLGDNLDLPDFGRYRKSVAFAHTTQAAIDYATILMGRLRAAAPDAEIVWLAGNHEERLQNWLIDNASAAYGLRQGRPTSGDWPVMSIPHLCRLDETNVSYVPGYPSEYWITPTLRAVHGDKVRSKGSTAHAYLPELRTSIIYGHIHRIEQAWSTRVDHDGPVTVMAASPGCLARVDGVVPSKGQRLDLDGRPIPRPEDWQSGLAVVTIDGDDWHYEQVRIHNHRAYWRGRTYGG